MTRPAATYRASDAGGLRVAAGPLALVAANVTTLVARGYSVCVRDPDEGGVAIHADGDHLHLSFHPGPGAAPTPPPWVGRLSDLWPRSATPPTTPTKRGATPHDNHNNHHRGCPATSPAPGPIWSSRSPRRPWPERRASTRPFSGCPTTPPPGSSAPPLSGPLDPLVASLVVAATEDGRDWKRPGVDRIVADATPPAGQGGIILLHDGGGNRAQTVAALDRLIPALQSQGYRFVTVSDIAGLARSSTNARVATLPRLQGVTLALVIRLSCLGHRPDRPPVHTDRPAVHPPRDRRPRAGSPPLTPGRPPWRRCLPAPGERRCARLQRGGGHAAAVRSLAASDYPDLEIIVVDDGSTDRTAAIVAALALPRVSLITQPNAGKPAALNAVVAAAHHDVLVMVDGDTVFEPDTVRELIRPFADPIVGAVSGNTKVGNRRGILGRWQHVEYVIGFNLDRRMYETLRCMPTVPGAIGAFRRQALVAVGGVSGDTLAEDTDLTIAVNRAGWRVVYESGPKHGPRRRPA